MLKITAQEEFWNWFIRHEEGLFTFDSNNETEREKLFDRLAIELQKVHPNLTFEFGPNEPVREFVISAGCIRRVFPAIDILRSGTRKDELLVDKGTLAKMYVLRRILAPMGTIDAIEFLLEKLRQSKTNDDFFESMNT